MSLKDQLAALESAKPRYFRQWLDLAPREDAELVMSYIKNPTIPVNQLTTTLASEGIPITRDTIIKLRGAHQ